MIGEFELEITLRHLYSQFRKEEEISKEEREKDLKFFLEKFGKEKENELNEEEYSLFCKFVLSNLFLHSLLLSLN